MTTTDTTTPETTEPGPASGGSPAPTDLPRWLRATPLLIGLALFPLVLLAGVPIAAWLVAMGTWLANRVAQDLVNSSVMSMPPHFAVGIAGLVMMLRVWISALVLFFVSARIEAGNIALGLGRPDIGIPAIIIFLVVLMVDVAVRGIGHLVQRSRAAQEGVSTAGTPAATTNVTVEE